MRNNLLVILGIFPIVDACRRPIPSPTPTTEQLMCGDSTMPAAVYRRATQPTLADSLSAIAITVEDSNHHRVTAADVQAWGPYGAIGGPGSPSGTTVFG